MEQHDEATIREAVDEAIAPLEAELGRLLDVYEHGIDRLDDAVTRLRAELDQFDAAQADINRRGIAETRAAIDEARGSRRVLAWAVRPGDNVNLGESHGWLDTTYANVALAIRSTRDGFIELHFDDGTSATLALDTHVRVQAAG